MYTVLDYGRMATDGVRMDAYVRAIERAVRPGCVVVDIGAGSGILSLLAARAGARRVHAVEPNPAVWVLADIARENGLADRITIHQTTSYELELPEGEKADVVVSDLRGSVPNHDAHFAVLRDARRRLLAPGGVLIPERDDFFVGLFEDEAFVRMLGRASIAFERQGWSAEATRRLMVNTPAADNDLPASALLTSGARWGHVVYGTDDVVLEAETELPFRRTGTAHGLAVWFSARILGDIGFTTEPGMSMAYHRLLLPLEKPVELVPSDRTRATIRASEDGERWAWELEVTGANGVTKCRQRQASFFGKPTSPEALLRESSTYAPKLSPRGERAKKALELMDGSRRLVDIADAARATSGPRLPASEVLDEVRRLAGHYGV